MVDEPSTESDSDEPVLESPLNPNLAMGPWHIAIIFCWCLLFLLLSYSPLRSTDIWGHVSHGRWIQQQLLSPLKSADNADAADEQPNANNIAKHLIANDFLPTKDPFLSLGEGMRVVDVSWLSQVIYALTIGLPSEEAPLSVSGLTWLSALFTATVLSAYLVLSRVYFLQCRLPLLCLAGTALALCVGWSRLTTIRPENFGFLLFALLMWLIVRTGAKTDDEGETQTASQSQPTGWALWIGVPVIMVLWANLHGSFICGLALIACYFLGTTTEAAWRTRSLKGVLSDPDVQGWLVLGEIATFATLLNPYGLDLLLETLWFANNDNLKSVTEWQSMAFFEVGGREFVMSWIVLTFVLRFSQKRMPVSHVLLLILFGYAAIAQVRMLTWYAPIFMLVAMPHLADIVRQMSAAGYLRKRAPALKLKAGDPLPPGRSWWMSVCGLLVIWIAFAISPIGGLVLGNDERTLSDVLDETTPVELSKTLPKHLRENDVTGLVYTPQWWGDWLVVSTRHEQFKPFMTNNMHLVPAQVWQDYWHLLDAKPNWRKILDRYAIDAIVVDKTKQEILLPVLQKDGEWEEVYSDELSALFIRKPTKDKANPPQEKGALAARR